MIFLSLCYHVDASYLTDVETDCDLFFVLSATTL